MAKRTRFVSCLIYSAVGCGALILLSIAGCVAFTAWLSAPGELLEPTELLDPRATAYVECRLRLEDESTRIFVDDFLEDLERINRQQTEKVDSPVIDFLSSWSSRKQRKDLERMFPMNAAWIGWPTSESGGGDILAASVERMAHQLALMDWVGGFVVERMEERPFHRIGEEVVYQLGDAGEVPFYVFADGRGVVVTFDLESAALAVEGIANRGRVESEEDRTPTELERLVATVPDELPLRGAVLAAGGKLEQLFWRMAGETALTRDWSALLAPARSMTVHGRFVEDGQIAFVVELQLDEGTPDADREELAAAAAMLIDEWGEGVEATGRPIEAGVAVEVRLDRLGEMLERLD